MRETDNDGQTFGSCLLTQNGRSGLVGQPVDGAKADRKFPTYGTPEDARRLQSAMHADGDLLAAVDDAETDGLTC